MFWLRSQPTCCIFDVVCIVDASHWVFTCFSLLLLLLNKFAKFLFVLLAKVAIVYVHVIENAKFWLVLARLCTEGSLILIGWQELITIYLVEKRTRMCAIVICLRTVFSLFALQMLMPLRSLLVVLITKNSNYDPIQSWHSCSQRTCCILCVNNHVFLHCALQCASQGDVYACCVSDETLLLPCRWIEARHCVFISSFSQLPSDADYCCERLFGICIFDHATVAVIVCCCAGCCLNYSVFL